MPPGRRWSPAGGRPPSGPSSFCHVELTSEKAQYRMLYVIAAGSDGAKRGRAGRFTAAGVVVGAVGTSGSGDRLEQDDHGARLLASSEPGPPALRLVSDWTVVIAQEGRLERRRCDLTLGSLVSRVVEGDEDHGDVVVAAAADRLVV